MKREYSCECTTGQPKVVAHRSAPPIPPPTAPETSRRSAPRPSAAHAPQVAYRETSSKQAKFAYTHKKQSGGAGQFGRVEGFVEPLDNPSAPAVFENELLGTNIPPEFVPAIEKGFREALAKGPLTGSPVMGVRVVLEARTKGRSGR